MIVRAAGAIMRNDIKNIGYLRNVSRKAVEDYPNEVESKIGSLDRFLRDDIPSTLLISFESICRLHVLPDDSPVETWVEHIAQARPDGGLPIVAKETRRQFPGPGGTKVTQALMPVREMGRRLDRVLTTERYALLQSDHPTRRSRRTRFGSKNDGRGGDCRGCTCCRRRS